MAEQSTGSSVVQRSFEEGLAPDLEMVNVIEAVNHGGCGVVALAILRRAIQDGVPEHQCQLIYMSDGKRDIEQSRKRFKETGKLGSISHVAVQIFGVPIDTNGIDQADLRIYRWELLYTPEVDAALVDALNGNEYASWNDSFPRGEIPTIGNYLNVNLDDVLMGRSMFT